MNDSPVTIENTENVATLFLDDGKANALGYQVIDALLEAFDEVETSDANALVLAGRPDRFSAGFDLSVMNEGSDAARGMLTKGVDLFLRMYMFSRPVVAACTGHAIAAGSILLLCSDLRVGSEGDFKVGLPEVTIGMALPFRNVITPKQQRLDQCIVLKVQSMQDSLTKSFLKKKLFLSLKKEQGAFQKWDKQR